MDAKSSAILSSYQEKITKPPSSLSEDDDSPDSDLDSLLELLDDDDDNLAAYREQRIQQLSQELKESKGRHSDAATVETLDNEAKLFELMNKMDTDVLDEKDNALLSSMGSTINPANQPERSRAQRKYRSLIIHFFHPDFRSCKLLDEVLSELASKHYNTTKFVRINAVVDAPFLVVKFKLRVLPAVLAFRDGKLVAKYNGMDNLVDPQTMKKLVSLQSQSQSGRNAGNPLDSLRKLDTQWIEKVFVEQGILFRSTNGASQKGGWNKDDTDSEDERTASNYKSIRSGKASSWKSTKKYKDDESDDDDGLDI